jgi:NAD(P)-dependent dehydrogenase (short-subunit alcohol dehydrogenase family)
MSRPVAIVTGASRGIGRAIADELGRTGFDLVGTGLDEEEAFEVPGARSIYVAGDVSDLAGHQPLVDAAVAAFGRIDLLVNNAGMGAVERGDFLDLRPENYDRVMAVNLRGPMFLTQAVLRWMLANPADGPRAIVNITSVSAAMASPERLDYCVSKAGLAMWSAGLALRLAAEGIAVFDVRPGIIRTDMTAASAPKHEERIAGGLVPAKRWGEPGDVATAVAALAGGGFSFATGSIVNVDGGLSIARL